MKSFAHHSLKTYNTFNIEAFCTRFVEIETCEEIAALVAEHTFEHPFLILGGGSNMLFTHDFDGTVLHPVFQGIKVVDETDAEVWLRVAAGEAWDTLVKFAIAHDYYGLENLVGIPGLVGSSPVQNIGAYGVEVKEVIDRVEAVSLDNGRNLSFTNADCQFAYRNSVFKNGLKNKVFITYVTFKLHKQPRFVLTYKALQDAVAALPEPLTLQKVADAVMKIRDSKLPKVGEVGSAGSFFKNPVVEETVFERLITQYPNLTSYPTADGKRKLSAAQLIDSCGCKSWREGSVAVFPTQPLVIVNYGDARGVDIVAFYQKISRAVEQRYGFSLEPEVNIVNLQ